MMDIDQRKNKKKPSEKRLPMLYRKALSEEK